MKKIITVKKLLIAMVFSVAVLGGYQAYEQVSHTNVDSFLLENVEALTTSFDFDGTDWNTTDTHWFGSNWKPVMVACKKTSHTSGGIGATGPGGWGANGSWGGTSTETNGKMVECQNGSGNCTNGSSCVSNPL